MTRKLFQSLTILALAISLFLSDQTIAQPVPHDILHAVGIALNLKVSGSIAPRSGLSDYYRIEAPSTPQDLLRVSLENRSTKLRAGLRVFDSQKSEITNASQETAGANVELFFVAEPRSVYYVQVEPYNGYDSGAYSVSVTPQHAYDKYEPNDDILHAAHIEIGETIHANCMNGMRRMRDNDYYRFTNLSRAQRLKISLTNQSTTLRPALHVFDGNKSEIANAGKATFGADVDLSFPAKPNATYYVWVEPFNDYDFGDYRLIVTKE